ncbi:MAG: hypothetical protein KKF10_01525, partial [Verrucomicrobia bacterium]|nr:hypothetical protein [Verrucomicrobiota bacterium]
MKKIIMLCVASATLLWPTVPNLLAADVKSSSGVYNLADFGPVKTPVEVEATLKAAITSIIAQGGGILVITPGVAPNWVAHNDAPSSTKDRSPSVTIVDRRNGREKILVPSNGQRMGGSTWAGRYISREVRQPIDMAMGVHSTECIDTFIAGGTTSYDQQSLEAVKAGENARIYVPTIRGLAVSNQIVVTGVAVGYGGQFESGPIKALGWDKEKGRAYIVMDLKHDHPKSALVYGKHVVNSLTLTDHSQSDNQSPCLMVKRKNYAQGDSFVIAAEACSQGNIMSGAGDEGGLTYASDISNDLRPFRSTVEVINWDQQELVYAPGLCRNHTLGTSRPVINLNTNKWITQGVAYLVSPGYRDPWHPDQVLSLGGVFGSKDCGWTRDIVGRFFAFDEPSEYLDPKNDPSVGYTAAPDMRVYRWYQVHKIEDHAVGIKRIYLERTRWWVHYYVPSLYNTDNWSYAPQDGKNRLKPLHYIIAPGAYVSDVSCAWTDSYGSGGRVEANNPRTLKLAPTPDIGTRFDFEKGDPIVQAIGSDP